MKNCSIYFFSLWLILASLVAGYPSRPQSLSSTSGLQHRTTPPYFPDSPPSCPICENNYPNINSCAQAAPILANFSMIIFNPGAFIDVIKCACADTFQSVFPQCVDCFTQTNQTDVLDTTNLPSIVNGMREVCSLASSLLGGAASANGEIPSSTTAPAPATTGDTDGTLARYLTSGQLVSVILGSVVLAFVL